MSDLQEARQRVSDLLERLRRRGLDAGQFGADLDILLEATAPQQKRPAPGPTESRVRRRDPGTSWDAAALVSHERSRLMYDAIYRTLASYEHPYRGLTDHELEHMLKDLGHAWPASSIRSRRAELVEAGWVSDSGHRRDSNYGRKSIVWKADGKVDS